MAQLVTFGELLIDFVFKGNSIPGGSTGGSEVWTAEPGGAPANVAVGAARLGVSTAFLGKVGDDRFGRSLERTLDAAGVDTRGLRFDPSARTALAFVSLDESGERSFEFFRHPSADMLYRPEEVAMDVVRSAQVFHFGSISLIAEPSRSATIAALEEARRASVVISFDPNLRLDLWPHAAAAREGIRHGWSFARIVKVSEEELEFLTGSKERGAARDLFSGDLQLLVITRGARGADYLLANAEGSVEGFEVAAVDTTGAGDSFMAALLAAFVADPQLIREPDSLVRVLRRANACAALTVTRRGAIPALPDAAQVDAFLSSQGRNA